MKSLTEEELKYQQRHEPIDKALDSVLRAAGSRLSNYTMEKTLDEMRKAMRKVMVDSYIAGSDAAYRAIKGDIE